MENPKMPISEIVKVLENEAACVERGKYCDRQCNKCDLVMDDKKILNAYASAIWYFTEPNMAISPLDDDGR